MAPLVVDKQHKKEQILRAALEVFAAQGYYRAKIADIAMRAGIGKGTVYEYFRTKEALCRELFVFMIDDHRRHLAIPWPGRLSAKAKLEHIVDATFRAFEEMENIYHILLDLKTEHLKGAGTPFYNEQFARLYREFRAELGMLLRQGMKSGEFRKVNPGYVASILIAAIEGILNQWIADRSAFSIRHMSAEIKKLAIGYVAA